MRRRRVALRPDFRFNCGLIVAASLLAVVVFAGIVLVVVVPTGGNARRGIEGLVGPKTHTPTTVPPTTLAPTLPPSAPTLAPTETPTVAPTNAPTAAPTPGPLAIVCPPPTAVTLGKPYNVDVTGNAVGSGGCMLGGPLVSSNDTRLLPYPAPNIVVESTRQEASATALVVTGSESLSQLVFAIGHASGTLITVVDQANVATTLGSFIMSSKGSCPGVGGGRVLYDFDAERWFMMERASAANDTLCFYFSDGPDILTAAWDVHPVQFPSVVYEARIGLWNRVYSLTLRGPVASLCVIDRQSLSPLQMFCKEPTPLSGFDASLQMWTPVTVKNAPLPPQPTEAAGAPGIGAVFMRHNDNELHDPLAAPTPAFDLIGIEHWANINFTTQFRQRVRYQTNVRDFNSSFARNVETPSMSVTLDPVRERIVSDATYRYLPECDNQESVVLAWTAWNERPHVMWAELRFRPPTPLSAPTFNREQDGFVSDTLFDTFLPGIDMDSNGTIAITYSKSSDSAWPITLAASRLRNDPLDKIRDPITLHTGTSADSDWPRYAGVASLTNDARQFFTSGVVNSPSDAHCDRIRISSDQVERTFFAYDGCAATQTCPQIINLL